MKNEEYKDGQTFRRSRHALNPAVMFYVRWMVHFLFWMLLIVIIDLLSGDDVDHLFDGLLFFACFSVFLGLFWVSFNSGSLVETVHIDYVKQEIRVLRYTLWGRQRMVKIPFEGFYWEMYRPGRFLDRLRLFPLAGKKIVICHGGLTGWTGEDFNALKTALSEIVPEDYWLNKGSGKKYNVPYEQARAENTKAQ